MFCEILGFHTWYVNFQMFSSPKEQRKVLSLYLKCCQMGETSVSVALPVITDAFRNI